jgi:hypothetical protein
MTDIETVAEDCKHKDCKYRGQLSGAPWCMYMLITDKPRGCSISKCNKYASGKLKTISTLDGMRMVDDDL